MALINVPAFLYPEPWTAAGYFQSPQTPYNDFTMNASTDKMAFVLRAPKGIGVDQADSRLAKVGFRMGSTIGQFPANGLKVSFQDLSATDGNPAGTNVFFSTITSNPGTNGWAKVPTYMGSTGGGTGSRRVVTAGDLFTIVIEFASFVSGDSVTIAALLTATNRGFLGNSYVIQNTASAWTKSLNTIPTFELQYDDGSYAVIQDVMPAKVMNTQNFNNTGTDQLALMWQVPFDCKVNGAWVVMDAAGSVDFILYNPSDTAVFTVNMDPDQRDRQGICTHWVPFPGTLSVSRNTDHKLAVLGKDATTNKLVYMDVDTASVLDQVQGGQNFRWVTKNGAAAWAAPTTTRRPIMGLQISQIDDGTGAGGASLVRYHPGMAGGMRG